MDKSKITFENIRANVNSKPTYKLDARMLEQYANVHPRFFNKPIVPVPRTDIDKILVDKLKASIANTK